jgi:hypothetical protein
MEDPVCKIFRAKPHVVSDRLEVPDGNNILMCTAHRFGVFVLSWFACCPISMNGFSWESQTGYRSLGCRS